MKQTTTLLIDDLDGEPADETVTFGLDGHHYQIDLTAGNAAKLREVLAHYVPSARRVRTGGKVTRVTVPAERQRNQAIREWARTQGLEVSARGRLPIGVVTAYEVGHGVAA